MRTISVPAAMPSIKWFTPRSLLVGIALLFLVINTPARAGDLPNTPPDGWWWYYGQTPDQVGSLLKANNARLMSIQVEQAGPLLFTVAMVQNTGPYAKAWWWFYDQTETDIANHAKELNARVINIDAYEVRGKIYFAAIFISNTGNDAKGWWWYNGQAPANIASLLQQNNARLIDLRHYSSIGKRQYAVAMVENTGADATAWWWYVNISAAEVSSHLQQNGAYLVSLQLADANSPTFNVIMNKLPTPGGRGWWWYFGKSALELTGLYTQNAAWLRDVKTYEINGERVFTALMLGTEPRDEWYTYRYNILRTGTQPYASALSDPSKVGTLAVKWSFPDAGAAGAFKASPIVVNDTVFIGTVDGFFYALDAATGKLKWQYPKAGDQALLGSCHPDDFAGGIGHYGIQSSATFAVVGGQRAVIFGAPDPGAEGGLGSARLFAFTLQGGLIWKSEVVAHVNGCNRGNLQERHERIAFSSPLVLGNKVYVGVHDTGDSPIQQGQVVAVDVNTGKIDRQFNFVATGKPGDGTHGGGIWNALAADGTSVYFTTGNTRIPWCVYPYNCPPPVEPEPVPNHGLSMIRVDRDTGNINWKFQPVPFRLDGDPDWAAGAAVMSTSCGELIASVQKDGWSYAVNAGNGRVQWQFPPTEVPFTRETLVHGDDDYRRPGAAWNDVFIVRTGGENLVQDGVGAGYFKLYALNACAATERDRVRWIADIPNIMGGGGHISYGTPTVTGGIVFIGTNEDPIDHKGHLVVLGDPSVVSPVGWRCSNPNVFFSGFVCTILGYSLVPIPKVLADFPMPDGGSLAAMRNEPVLAKGRVFVATSRGHVYMLRP